MERKSDRTGDTQEKGEREREREREKEREEGEGTTQQSAHTAPGLRCDSKRVDVCKKQGHMIVSVIVSLLCFTPLPLTDNTGKLSTSSSKHKN